MNLSKKFLVSVALMITMLPFANLLAQQPIVNITVQQNTGNGNIRVGGTYSNADHLTIDVLNKTDNQKISAQNVIIQSGGKWYYDKPVVAGKTYKFAVRAWNRNSEKWAEYDNAKAAPQPLQTPPAVQQPRTIKTIETRWIVCDMPATKHTYAEFVYGAAKAPTGSSSNSFGADIGINTQGFSGGLSYAYSTNRDKIYGVYIPKSTTAKDAVNYFPESAYGGKGARVILDNGKPYDIGKDWNNSKNQYDKVLISWKGVFFYIDRNCLGTSLP